MDKQKDTIKLLYEGLNFLALYFEDKSVCDYYMHYGYYDVFERCDMAWKGDEYTPNILLLLDINNRNYSVETHMYAFGKFNEKHVEFIPYEDNDLINRDCFGDTLLKFLRRMDTVMAMASVFSANSDTRGYSFVYDLTNTLCDFESFCSEYSNDYYRNMMYAYHNNTLIAEYVKTKLVLAYYYIDIADYIMKNYDVSCCSSDKTEVSFTSDLFGRYNSVLMSEFDTILTNYDKSDKDFIRKLSVALLDNDFLVGAAKHVEYSYEDKRRYLLDGLIKCFSNISAKDVVFSDKLKISLMLESNIAGVCLASQQSYVNNYFLGSLMKFISEVGTISSMKFNGFDYWCKSNWCKDVKDGLLEIEGAFYFKSLCTSEYISDLYMREEAFEAIKPFLKFAWVMYLFRDDEDTRRQLKIKREYIDISSVRVFLRRDRNGIVFNYRAQI